MTRSEHLAWCKERALEYANMGEFQSAVASMGSDLRKHPETERHAGIQLGVMLMMGGMLNTEQKVVEWINGFN